jgi:hypothetical protein
MWQRGGLHGTKMKTIAIYDGRTLATGKNDKICHWLRATDNGAVCATTTPPLWGLSNYRNTDIARTMIQGDFSIH